MSMVLAFGWRGAGRAEFHSIAGAVPPATTRYQSNQRTVQGPMPPPYNQYRYVSSLTPVMMDVSVFSRWFGQISEKPTTPHRVKEVMPMSSNTHEGIASEVAGR